MEVIIGTVEKRIKIVFLDDRYARNKAKQLGFTVTGTLGALAIAKKRGIISNIENDIKRLQAFGMHISDEVIETILSL